MSITKGELIYLDNPEDAPGKCHCGGWFDLPIVGWKGEYSSRLKFLEWSCAWCNQKVVNTVKELNGKFEVSGIPSNKINIIKSK